MTWQNVALIALLSLIAGFVLARALYGKRSKS